MTEAGVAAQGFVFSVRAETRVIKAAPKQEEPEGKPASDPREDAKEERRADD